VLLAGATAILIVLTIQWTPLVLLAVAAVGYLMYRERSLRTVTAAAEPTEPAPPQPSQFPPPFPPDQPGPAAQPGQPSQQTRPAEPGEPGPPDESVQHTEPDQLGGSAQPSESAQLGESAVQGESDQAGEPDQLGEPLQHTDHIETGEAMPSADSEAGTRYTGPEQGAEPETLAGAVPPEEAEPEEDLLVLAEQYRTGRDVVTEPIWPEPPAWQQPPQPPAPDSKPERPPASRLGRVALFAILIALGLVAASALLGANPGFGGYVATALAVVGAALVVGTWFGRARGLIGLGAVLAVVLAISSAVESANLSADGEQGWHPTTVSEIEDDYKIDLGDGTLNLQDVDFTDQNVTIGLEVNAGNLTVIVPPDVDVVGTADVSYGNADILGQEISAGRGAERDFSDPGADQAEGPGQLTLDVTVNAGNLEVIR
jgi:hypothetical protein